SIMLPMILSRSKSVRLPSFFTSRGIFRSTRSYVVERFSQVPHLRRPRTVFASRLARVSPPCVSSEPQNGHFMRFSLVHREPGTERLPLARHPPPVGGAG